MLPERVLIGKCCQLHSNYEEGIQGKPEWTEPFNMLTKMEN